MGHELADLIEALNVRFIADGPTLEYGAVLVLPGSYLMVHSNFRD